MADARVLIVIPTLGSRLDYLDRSLASIRAQSVPVDVTIVAPLDNSEIPTLASRWDARLMADPGSLAAAINLGVSSAQPHHEFVNWLGDDDSLEPETLHLTLHALDTHPACVVAYGACRYVDGSDRELWVSKAGSWAPRILKWGPDLIPQPGMLVRRDAWQRVGGLDEAMRFAFDLDLLLKLQRLGPFIDVGAVVSQFRWHEDSLTVGDRSTSLHESEIARRRSLGPIARRLAWTWEPPVRLATRLAAREVSRRARRVMQGSER